MAAAMLVFAEFLIAHHGRPRLSSVVWLQETWFGPVTDKSIPPQSLLLEA